MVVGVTSTPFKCPPAPSETALLMHDYLARAGCWTVRGLAGDAAGRADPAVAAGVRRRSSPRSPNAASAGTPAAGPRARPGRKVARLGDGAELPYDLFLGVPVHRAPAVVVEPA